MKLQTINKIMLILKTISLKREQLKKLHSSTISTLNTIKQTKTTKIFQLMHKIFHCGIDILTITNEIIDLQNN